MLKIRVISVALAAGLLTGCVGGAGGAAVSAEHEGGERREKGDRSERVESAPAEAGVLAMPEVPALITGREARAAYAAEHFWDALTADTAGGTGAMEQNLANFAVIAAQAPAGAQRRGFASMWSRTGLTDSVLMPIVESYLYDPESPVYSPDLMMSALAAADSLQRLPSGCRESLLLGELRRNAPGTRAADVAYTDRHGRQHRLLHDNRVAQLVVFYDPDCEHCAEEMSMLAASEELARAVAEGEVAVRAIYPGADERRWREHAAGLPGAWTVGMNARDPVGAQGAYDIRTTPSIYLLDDGGMVVLREARAATALACISAGM